MGTRSMASKPSKALNPSFSEPLLGRASKEVRVRKHLASGGLCVFIKLDAPKSKQSTIMSQSFECLLCKHSFSSVDDPKLKVLSFFLFVVAIILLFGAWPLSIVLFFVIWYGNVPKCPRCKSRKLLRQEKKYEKPTEELLNSPKIQVSKKGMGCMTVFLCGSIAFVALSMGYLFWYAASVPPKPESIYKTAEADLMVVIDEEKDYVMLDVRNALQRLMDDKVLWEYPFTAIKDPNGGGYFGIFLLPSPSGTFNGEAIFLVSEEALNQTSQSDLQKSIRYVNGLASDFADQNIEQAKGYEPLAVMEQVSTTSEE